ncbi:dihydrolipoamide dehydrogenase [Candidatus Nanohaloarchaea archaeon]|nr:dihydrolipoamide dehydrogenase [Candidatus Nanohaloarchaea archaeon]
MKEFDLIVIGSGSGLDIASGIANKGKDVAVVEPGRLGGTCLNRGCIPSKMLIHRADLAEDIRDSEKFGLHAELEEVDFNDIIEEVNHEVHSDSENIEEGLRNSSRHTLYRQEARFVDEKIIELKESGEKIISDTIVVAAGSRPFVPPIDGTDEVDYWVSTDALNPDYQPDELIMVGGGYISLELAHFYDAMGTEVTVLEMGEKVLEREDREISEKITEIAKNRYNVELEVSATEIREEGGRKKVIAEDSEGEKVEFAGDEILFATGRVPNTDSLKVEEAGIETTERGFVKTDEKMRTSIDGIYALGDIADNWMFKHSANHEAEIVFKNIVTGDQYDVDYPGMPHAVFTSPQIAGVGKTEQELEEEDVEYVSATYDYADTGMGMALKEEDGFVKVLASEDGEILGCHIIGPHASQQIHEVLVAMKAGTGTVDDIKDTIHIHPALNEVVQRAFNQL